MKYICVQCGYIYDPEIGDNLNQIPPHTPFDNLPEGWVCPLCYSPKSLFDPLD